VRPSKARPRGPRQGARTIPELRVVGATWGATGRPGGWPSARRPTPTRGGHRGAGPLFIHPRRTRDKVREFLTVSDRVLYATYFTLRDGDPRGRAKVVAGLHYRTGSSSVWNAMSTRASTRGLGCPRESSGRSSGERPPLAPAVSAGERADRVEDGRQGFGPGYRSGRRLVGSHIVSLILVALTASATRPPGVATTGSTSRRRSGNQSSAPARADGSLETLRGHAGRGSDGRRDPPRRRGRCSPRDSLGGSDTNDLHAADLKLLKTANRAVRAGSRRSGRRGPMARRKGKVVRGFVSSVDCSVFSPTPWSGRRSTTGRSPCARRRAPRISRPVGISELRFMVDSTRGTSPAADDPTATTSS